jgi:cytochrome P450
MPPDISAFSLTDPPPGFVDDPYPTYAALRERSPVHEMAPGVLLLTRYADVAQLYRDARASSDKKREFAPKFGHSPLYEHHTTSLVFNDPPLHTRVRRLMLGALDQRAIARMEAGVVALVDSLLERMAGLDAPDLIDDFAARIPVEVIGNLLAVPHAQRAPLRDWSLAILSALEPAPGPDVLARGNAAVRDFKHCLEGLVAERRQRPGDPDADVLTRLIQGECDDGEGLSPLELVHNCIFLLNAGHETTTNLIGNGMHALPTHRDQLDRLAADPALLPSAIEELLRYESPLQLNNRVLAEPVEIGGRTWPAGTFITLGVGAANRDPAQFPDPDRLDLARKPNPHVAFGHGAHACAGMNVARLEARVAVGRLLSRHPDIEPAGSPQRDRRVRFRGFRHLPVRLG